MKRVTTALRLSSGLTVALLMTAMMVVAAGKCPKCKRNDCDYMVGVNLAGAEFAPHAFPGVEGRHYGWPTAECLDYWKSKGIKLIRLPFLWQRLQPEFMKDFDPKYVAGLDRTVKMIEDRKMKVILDVHNYKCYRGKAIGEEGRPVEAFADLWTRLAKRYKDSRAIWGYGLMNEPTGRGMPWKQVAQVGIDAIRKVDRKTQILVANDYPGWKCSFVAKKYKTDKELAEWADKELSIGDPKMLKDPADNLRFELHTYFDHDASGTYRKSYQVESSRTDGPGTRVCAEIGIHRMQPFVAWLKKHKARGFIGEFSAPANPDKDPRWMDILDTTMAYMQKNCLPSTFWAGGTRWTPGHAWVCERSGWSKNLSEADRQKDRPQVKYLQKYNRK